MKHIVLCLLIGFFQPLFALPQYPRDSDLLFITEFTDPNFPVPRVGERAVSAKLKPPSKWTAISLHIEHTDVLADLRPNSITGNAVSQNVTLNGSLRGEHIFDWERPWDSELADKPAETYPANSEVFYRWRVQYQENGSPVVVRGDIHRFTMPRRILLAIMGDSYGSGEGAPNRDAALGGAWKSGLEGSRGHRSPISGQELAVKAFFENRPNLAYDYVNVSSSGAIAVDIYSDHSQHERLLAADAAPAETDERAVTFPQAAKLSEWLSTRNYEALDAVILSCGGNDVGFESLLTAYLGLNKELLLDSFISTPAGAACVVPAISAYFQEGTAAAVAAYAGCIQSGVVDLMNPDNMIDYTFKQPYHPGKKSSAITDEYKPFTFYENRLRGEYDSLGSALVGGLSSNGLPVAARNVLVTTYPFPLKDCTRYEETPPILALLLEKRFIEIDISHPALDFINGPDPFTIRYDVASFPMFPLIISEGETIEASIELAPPADAPRPALGGINHLIEEYVSDLDARYPGTDWSLVKVNNFLPPFTGLCYTNTHFNSLSAALDLAGPNRISNAFHPNQLGHEFTYKPAILAMLEQKLTPDALEAAATADGLEPAAAFKPDLTFESQPSFDFDPATGLLTIGATIINNGNSASPSGVAVSFRLEGSNLLSVPLPLIDPGNTHTLKTDLNVPFLPLVPNPYLCENGPFPGFESYAEKDQVLRYFLSFEFATLNLRIDPDGLLEEINSRNNSESIEVVRGANPAPNNLGNLAVQTLSELSALLGRGVSTVDHALLIDDSRVRAYFGYYSPELDLEKLEPIEVLTRNQSYKFGFCLAQQIGGTVPKPPPYGGVPIPDVDPMFRPICLFPKPESDCGQTGSQLVMDSMGRIASFRDFLTTVVADGRSIAFSSVLDERLASIVGNPLLDLSMNTPQLTGALGVPAFGSTLGSKTGGFQLLPIQDTIGATLTLGTVAGGNDLVGSMFLPADGTSVEVRGLPQDGRSVHAIVETLFADGSTRFATYEYPTTFRNGRIVSPGPNQLMQGAADIGPGTNRIAWLAPDINAGGPVQAYRLAIGSFPGVGDVFPGIPPEMEGSLPPGAIRFRQLPATDSSFGLVNVPRDGRTLYITLGTLRDGEWQYEIHRRSAALANNSGIRTPRPDQPIRSSEKFTLSVGREPANTLQFQLGTLPGGNDIYDSGVIRGASAGEGFEIALGDYETLIDGQGRPIPIHASIRTNRDRGEDLEQYALVPSPNSSLHLPRADQLIPAGSMARFAWNPGTQATGYRLRLYTRGSRLLFDKKFEPSTREVDVDLSNQNATVIIARLDTIRDPIIESPLPDGVHIASYIIDQPSLSLYDNDGIDNEWQFRYFGSLNPNALPGEDSDGDGFSNFAEFLARTNPLDPNDFPRADAVLLPDGKISAFMTKAVATTRYRLLASEDLGGWTPASPYINAAPAAETLHIPVPPSEQDRMFYRIELSPRPPQ